jgi:hypothetical protein
MIRRNPADPVISQLLHISLRDMTLRNNSFSALAVDSDTMTISTTVKMDESLVKTPLPASPKKTRGRQWQPVDLGAVSSQPRDHRQTRGRRAVTSATIVASGSAPKFVRKLVNGRLVLVQINKVAPAKVTIDEDSFPAVLPVSAPTRVSGSWATGVQSIRKASDLPDPAIAKRQREHAKTVWLKRQRAAEVVTSNGYDVGFSVNELETNDGLDGEAYELETIVGLELEVGALDVPVADTSVYAPVMDGEEKDSLRRVVLHEAAADDDW